MAKFKAGDRVYYRDDVNDTGTIVEPAGPNRWWVMWDKTQVRLSAYEHNLNLIEEKNAKFKVGDRVLEKSPHGEQAIGVITRRVDEWKFATDDAWWIMWETGSSSGEERWTFEKFLKLIDDSDKNMKTNFKVGDRVCYLRLIGTIVDHDRADGFQVEWDDLNSYKMWLTGDVLALAQESGVHTGADQTAHSKDTIDTYTVAEFKKLLDKMDDNLILQMTDLRILFNRVPK